MSGNSTGGLIGIAAGKIKDLRHKEQKVREEIRRGEEVCGGEEIIRRGEDIIRGGEEIIRRGEEIVRRGEEIIQRGEEIHRGEGSMAAGFEVVIRVQSVKPV